VLQFNTLADGLAGLRQDLGNFSRVKKEYLDWSYRRDKLLQEVVQYEPDIITLQEVDHYYDFFLPELSSRGYIGFFAQKPTSGCLEVSGNNDGCASFSIRIQFELRDCRTIYTQIYLFIYYNLVY
jgi:nocturnin